MAGIAAATPLSPIEDTRLKKSLFPAAALVLLSACGANSRYTVDASESAFQRRIGGEESQLVLMRVGRVGWTIDAPVFELIDGEPRLVGISSARTKLTVPLTPGKHTFMVVGHAADFMEVNAAPGKVYYALVQPRVTGEKTSFVLQPLKKRRACEREDAFDRARIRDWLAASRYIVLRGAAEEWFAEHAADVKKKQAAHWPAWRGKASRKCFVAAETDGDERS